MAYRLGFSVCYYCVCSSPKSDTVDAVCRSPRYVQLGAFKCASLADARRRCQLIVHESGVLVAPLLL